MLRIICKFLAASLGFALIKAESFYEMGTVVIENGSGWIKAGIGGDHLPAQIISTETEDDSKPLITNGLISNWEKLEVLWGDVFSRQLGIEPNDHTILSTESPLNSNEIREKMAAILFETFEFPAIFIANEAVLSLHHSGRTSGVVAQCGYGSTYAVPIYQSCALRNATMVSNFGGKHLTSSLKSMLYQDGLKAGIVDELKHKLCFVAEDFDLGMTIESRAFKRTHKLPDGQFITLEKERFECPEALFKPSLLKEDHIALQQLTNGGILSTDTELHSLLYGNIVVTGGSSLLPGLRKRLEREVRKMASGNIENVRVDAPDGREVGSWIGGSIISAIPTFQNLCLTRAEYEEVGADAVHWKFF